MITAIGTGIGDEYDVEKLRYHRVIVMTDADVDGAHIRTLILTFLFRQMPELVERGHVYIAVAPLYRVKIGNQETYVEKESQFEDLLIRERIKDMEVTDRDGETQKLTEARYRRLAGPLAELEGYAARLRADYGAQPVNFLLEHRLLEMPDAATDFQRALAGLDTDGYELDLVDSAKDSFRIKVVEKETSAAKHVTVPAELLASSHYAQLAAKYARLQELIGRPPFRITLGKKSRVADTFEQLRNQAIDLAKEGIEVGRFKGLGEMDAEDLWATTMNPANRMLIRVEVEDTAAADLAFSMLMGDQVEPRRLFIEQNARDVKFLDV
jgi:DNA gyrase subunit B